MRYNAMIHQIPRRRPQTRKAAAISERRRKAKQAYDATSEAWKKATYRFAVERFLPQTVVFLFEELTKGFL